jgi:ribokinase
VILDAGGMEGAISEELLMCTTVISPNETELERMTGMPTRSDDEIHAAAFSLLDRGVEAVLLKLGAKGSVMLRSAGHRRAQLNMLATPMRILTGMAREIRSQR